MRRFMIFIASLLMLAHVVDAQNVETVKLNLSTESTTAVMPSLKKGDMVAINGEMCKVEAGRKGELFIKAPKSGDGVYKGAYPADVAQFEGGVLKRILLVPAQLYAKRGVLPLYMPMIAEQTSNGSLHFKRLCGVLSFKVSGDVAVNSIKVEDADGMPLTGYFTPEADGVKRTLKEFVVDNYAVLECSNNGNGVQLDKSGKLFHLVLPVGRYDNGVKITIVDRAHHSMTCQSQPFEIKRGAVTTIAPIAYAHADDQIFAEHFDNMVYGGNIIGGKECVCANPVGENGIINNMYNGTERAIYHSDFKQSGSDYMQRSWKKKPTEDGAMSAEYLANRNIAEYKSLLRAQECHGFVAVGVKDHNRGIFQTPSFADIEGVADVEITFKFVPELRATTDYDLKVFDAGVIKEYWVDGVKHSLTPNNYPYKSSNVENLVLSRRSVIIYNPPVEAVKPWHEIRLVVSGATAKTSFGVVAQNMGEKQRNGFYIDDIEVKLLKSVKRDDILRVMCYNIQNGMWADQPNNYDNFVEYMKHEDIDIAVFCEASSIYYNHTKQRSKHVERYLPYKNQEYSTKDSVYREPKGWIELAARYGHNYVQIGAHQDNYPVVVTSKYPIVYSQRLGGKQVSHGGIHAQIEVDGEIVNVVGFHTWPQPWHKFITKEERVQSALNFGGHKMRCDEIRIFMERTILNPKFADQKHWIVTGDMNCNSPLDDLSFDVGYMHPRYFGQRYLLENVPQIKDLIKTYGCPDKRDVLIPTTMRGNRIDFIYGSEKFVNTMIKAKSPKEGFSKGTFDKSTGFFKGCGSDHLPLIVDFHWR